MATVTSATKLFPTAQEGFTTTLASTISSGAATVPLNSVTGYANGETIVLVVDPTDASKKQAFTGVVDTAGVQLTGVVWTEGTNTSHTAGATVVDYETATHWALYSKGLLRDHNQSGYHKTLKDDNGNEWIAQTSTASAVNEVTVANAATGNNPIISATGGDTNVGLTLTPKGSGAIKMTKQYDAWVSGLPTPDTVTNNGNRSYDMVFNSVDLTSYLSNGMRLKCTRTVTAPTQCTDLEAGSSQYFSKTSPSGLSFTDDFTCMGWVKLESYTAQMGIIARRNADTEGWSMSISADGRVNISALRIAGNNSSTNSYQSIPLNKWVHVAATVDLSGTSVLIYIDGVLVPSSTVINGTITALVQGTTALVAGAEKSAGTNPFDGKLAQAAVFSSVLSASTIRSYMSQTLSGSESTCVACFTLNNSLTDTSANANTVTAQGGALATATDTPFAQGATGTTEYAIITAASFSTNTTLTVQVPEGCALPTSGGISAVSYSTQKAPYGMPIQEDKWRIETHSKTATGQSAPVLSTWYNLDSVSISIPVGEWLATYECALYLDVAATAAGGKVTLSTTNNSEVDKRRTCRIFSNAASSIMQSVKREFGLSVSSATPYYLNATKTDGTLNNIFFYGTDVTTIISLKPAYL
jgi:hypothetical protein